MDVLDILLPLMNAQEKHTALYHALSFRNFGAARQIISAGADAAEFLNNPLNAEAWRGQEDIVQELLRELDPESLSGSPIWDAAEHGHPKIVELLIPFSNSQYIWHAIFAACEGRHTEVIDLLYPLCSDDEISTLLNTDGGAWPGADLIVQRQESERNKRALTQELGQQLNDTDARAGKGMKL